ncbi:hypothetical protein SPRG_08788 [Saprolegnia parasitica CBS 223.65]|uniref:Ribosomal RNA methyltransferase FtsJ domain-containing protein n=1 Tax=Saprolegnia parasitica (strain CBS 223.65) TaxID=695850 RepID=A0A067C4Z0_SAPPC|nr:hypothetical protein SPRG_08788 [Saprolegnia parasitica CBS 223.65]KDO25844.1 hypothetical protein SPRG_08788 [Saprolegnia parasitica CBS 223.65]|eukprot:XP_012203408.1 hypothetical protein SPRG_08788 [Saprolegnia parasitica CBS 223.65]
MDERLAVVHVEATQVDRFRTRINALGGATVASVAPPLLYVRYAAAQWPLLQDLCCAGRIAAHRVYEVDATCRDPGWIPYSAAMQSTRRATFRVVAYPSSLQSGLVALLAEQGIATDPKRYTHELHAVHDAPVFRFGVVPRRVIAEAPLADAVPCRAYHKLAEALLDQTPFPTGYRAIDIGASPGGWTEFLSSAGAAVVAVDPGELTVAHPNVLHLPLLLEHALDQIAAMDKFHVCVCDINIRPQLMASLIASVAPHLHPHAIVVLTLKLSKRPTDAAVDQAIHDVCLALDDEFEHFRIEWLHANTVNERTLFARKKAIADDRSAGDLAAH